MGTVYELEILSGPNKSELVRSLSVGKGSARKIVEFDVRPRSRKENPAKTYTVRVVIDGLRRRFGNDTDLTIWAVFVVEPAKWYQEPKPYARQAIRGIYDANGHTGFFKFVKS